MTIQPGNIYTPANSAELRDDFLRDLRLEALNQGFSDPPVEPGTDWYIVATAVAEAHLTQYANIAIQDQNSDLLTATGQALDDKRKAFGLPVVDPSPSTGKIVIDVQGGGTVTIPDGLQFVLPNGLRGKVVGTHLGVADGGEVSVVSIDKGSQANLAAGKKVRFVSPPLNVETEATVSINQPLTGGQDAETDERKRERIQNRLANPPQGGNWSHKIEVSLNALASVQYAFVYPALGGPASEQVILVRDIDVANLDFSRQLTDTAANIVRAALFSEFGAPFDLYVKSAVDEATDVAIKVTIPDSTLAGGDGTGWTNSTVWPPLDGGDTHVEISSYTAGSTSVTVNASTSTAPVAGVTEIAWWSPNDMQFHKRLVVAQSGGSGAWVLTLDAPLTDSLNNAATATEYISPSAENLVAYGQTWRTIMRNMGPGEATAAGARLPRAQRQPRQSVTFPSDLTIEQLNTLSATHGEISDASWSVRSKSSPTVPGAVSTPPNVLVPRQFGIYKL